MQSDECGSGFDGVLKIARALLQSDKISQIHLWDAAGGKGVGGGGGRGGG